MKRTRRPSRASSAFTLVELMTVIAILALLLMILLPTLQRVRGLGQDLACRSQFHQIGAAFATLASTHKGRLPGLWGPPWTGEELWQKSWMGSEAFTTTYRPAGPCQYVGTTVEILGGEEAARKLYRCPGLPKGAFASGQGSNGLFDLSMIQALPGAKTSAMPLTATVVLHSVQATPAVPIPVIIEEDPAQNINYQHIDMGHTAYNRMGSWHVGGSSNYFTIDGSVVHLNFNGGVGPEATDWVARGPSGTLRSLGVSLPYGGWNSQ